MIVFMPTMCLLLYFTALRCNDKMKISAFVQFRGVTRPGGETPLDFDTK